jgi:hypothetical protein
MEPYLLSTCIHQGTGALAIKVSEVNVIKPIFGKEDIKLVFLCIN